jgi:hypothetical protein
MIWLTLRLVGDPDFFLGDPFLLVFGGDAMRAMKEVRRAGSAMNMFVSISLWLLLAAICVKK